MSHTEQPVSMKDVTLLKQCDSLTEKNRKVDLGF